MQVLLHNASNVVLLVKRSFKARSCSFLIQFELLEGLSDFVHYVSQ